MTTNASLRIGTDLDGVTYDFVESFRRYLTTWRAFRRTTLPEPTTWAMWDSWPMTKDEWRTYFRDGIEAGVIFGGGASMAYVGAVEALHDFRADGHTIHIVTHRPPAAEAITVAWLAAANIVHDGLTFSEDKTVEPVDVMIEDNIDNAVACARAGIAVLLFERPWNTAEWVRRDGVAVNAKRYTATEPLITRVNGWAEAAERIEAMAADVSGEPAEDTTNPKDLIGLGKPRLDLVPPSALIEMARAMADGADKYGAYNWRTKDVRLTVYVAAILRHVAQLLDGEDVAADSGVKHLGHILACAGILVDAEAGGHLVDDRPPKGSASALIEAYTTEA